MTRPLYPVDSSSRGYPQLLRDSRWRAYWTDGEPVTVDDFAAETPKERRRSTLLMKALAFYGLNLGIRSKFTAWNALP